MRTQTSKILGIAAMFMLVSVVGTWYAFGDIYARAAVPEFKKNIQTIWKSGLHSAMTNWLTINECSSGTTGISAPACLKNTLILTSPVSSISAGSEFVIKGHATFDAPFNYCANPSWDYKINTSPWAITGGAIQVCPNFISGPENTTYPGGILSYNSGWRYSTNKIFEIPLKAPSKTGVHVIHLGADFQNISAPAGWPGWMEAIKGEIEIIVVDPPTQNKVPEVPSCTISPLENLTGEEFTITAKSSDPDGNNLKYKFIFDNGETVVSPFTGYVPSNTAQSVKKRWSTSGTKQIKVQSVDEKGGESPLVSCSAKVNDPPPQNSAPLAPSCEISPSEGPTNSNFTIKAKSTDPEGDSLKYEFAFDGNFSSTIYKPASGYSQSGVEHTTIKQWTSEGSKTVSIRAIDSKGASSEWKSCFVSVKNPEPADKFECRPAEGSASGWFNGSLRLPIGEADTDSISLTRSFTIECWNTAAPNEPHVFDTVAVKVAEPEKPDLTATIPTAQFMSGKQSGKESQNIFSLGATIRISSEVRNIGASGSSASKTGWRKAEGAIPSSADAMAELSPRADTSATDAGGSAVVSREIVLSKEGDVGIAVCADEGKTISESNETNNCSGILRITVQVDQPPPIVPPPQTGGWDGWIKLSGQVTSDKGQGTVEYGVRYDPETTRFCGYAWGGNVVGWVKFGPLPGELSAGKKVRAGFADWVCDRTNEPYRVISGSESGDWTRLEDKIDAGLKSRRVDQLPIVLPYDDLIEKKVFSLVGYAWSDNIGWISLSGSGTDKDSKKFNYGVNMNTGEDTVSGENPKDRNLTGFAWSDNIGWVKFDAVPFGVEAYPENPQKSTYINIRPDRDSDNTATSTLGGWARACSATVGRDCASATRKD